MVWFGNRMVTGRQELLTFQEKHPRRRGFNEVPLPVFPRLGPKAYLPNQFLSSRDLAIF